jgi:hypothetical protein
MTLLAYLHKRRSVVDQSLMSHLSEGDFGEEALAAYGKFPGGKELIEK